MYSLIKTVAGYSIMNGVNEISLFNKDEFTIAINKYLSLIEDAHKQKISKIQLEDNDRILKLTFEFDK